MDQVKIINDDVLNLDETKLFKERLFLDLL